MAGFMFATGIENSCPVIAGGVRVDEMDKCGHYRRWAEDLALVREMHIPFLRWGPAIYQTFLAPGRYEWSWVDDVLAEMQRLKIEPILDLCHFGLPDWLGNFQNRDFPRYFAEYASAFARRYPHLRYWTPVNEPLITALFSAKYGWWNERLTSDKAFVRAVLNIARAALLAMEAIQQQAPQAVFVHSESCEYMHPARPDLREMADHFNDLRFLPLDLIFGHRVGTETYRYLLASGMTEDEFAFFQQPSGRFRCLLGTDYYVTNEHFLHPNGKTSPAGEIYGYCTLARQYYERYRVPLVHTETNRWEEEDSVAWLLKQWHCLWRLRQDGMPVQGFTWYSLTDQMDWDTALREDRRRVNSVGLFDLDRNLRKVGSEYGRLIREWKDFLPVEEFGHSEARDRKRAA